jgi:hypothetical protein
LNLYVNQDSNPWGAANLESSTMVAATNESLISEHLTREIQNMQSAK